MVDDWVRGDEGSEPDVFESLAPPTASGQVALHAAEAETLVALSGEIDLSLASELDRVGQQAIDRDRPIRVDLSAVTFIDSTALGCLVQMAGAERERGRRLVVTGTNRRTAETFRLSGLGDLLDRP